MCLESCTRPQWFEDGCCFHCQCELSPCCKGVCSCCKCWTWCKYCCPCLCWPPRPCMAWFLGLFGLLFMLSTVASHEWVEFPEEGIDGPLVYLRGNDSGLRVTRSSWGLWSGSVLAGDEWRYDAVVETAVTATKFVFDQRVPDWLGSLGLCLCVGEIVLVVGLVVVFVGLCACCAGCVDAVARGKLFRLGMYLYLIADLLFFGSLIYFPFGLKAEREKAENSFAFNVPSTYGWGWGVVILVFVGALLLLLDKPVPAKSGAENEKLLEANA